MADVARVGLTLAGGAFFGPVGALVGGLLGNILFPQKLPDVKGPRLNELNVQRSTVGAPIPIVYGTARLAGNIDFHGGLREVRNDEEVGGKGGGPSQTVSTYQYYVDLGVLICESEDGRPSKIAGIRRIWAYGDVIYDLTPQRDDESTDDYNARIATSNQTAEIMTVYLGDETQLPSPMIESYEGVGNVPAFRGYCRVEFAQFPLNKYGNAVPNFVFEVYTDGTLTDVDCTQYSAGNLEPWQFQLDSGTYDPRNPANNHTYGYTVDGGVATGTLAQALADAEADVGRPFLLGATPQTSPYVHGWAPNPTANNIRPCEAATIADYVQVQISVNSQHSAGPYVCSGEISVTITVCAIINGLSGVSHIDAGPASGFYVHLNDPFDPTAPFFEGITGSHVCSGNGGQLLDSRIGVRRSILPPDPCSSGTALPNAPGYCVVDGVVTRALTWTPVSGTFKALQEYDDNGSLVTSYPLDPCLRNDDPDYNNATFWTAAYDAAVLAGDMPPGLTYNVDYPNTMSSAFVSSCEGESVEVACVEISAIVADICDRVGLSSDTDARVDVSDLQSCVLGYVVTRPMSARDAIGPLRTYGLFDARESADTLVFIERGGAITATIDAEELCAHETKAQRPPAVDITRVQEKDMPRRVRVHYANLDQNHEPAEQSASRTSTEAVSEIDVELPIVMQDDNAAQLAEIYLTEAYDAREVYKFAVSNRWLALEPADPIDLEIDGELQRCRITAIDYAIGGVLQVEAVRDDETTYGSTATGIPSQPSGDQGSPNVLVCPSEMVILDLPRLRREDVDCGYYVAPYGLCSSWECAGIYRSSDGGANYQRVASAEVQATVGEIDAVSGAPTGGSIIGASPIDYDTINTIDVTLLTIGATLSSVTDAQIEAGYNLAAIGADTRWVLVQYKTATLNSDGTYTLSDLLWGLTDTDVNLGTTVAGDSFVLMSGPGILRIGETVNNNGVEKQLKAVTCGSTVEDADAVDFTTHCLSYLPDIIDTDPPVIDSSVTVNNPDCATILKWNPTTEQYEPASLRLIEACDLLKDTSSYDVGDHIAVVDQDSSGPIFGIVPDTGGGSQAAIQFKDEGSNIGTAGAVTAVNFTGTAVTASHSAGTVTVNVTAAASGYPPQLGHAGV